MPDKDKDLREDDKSSSLGKIIKAAISVVVLVIVLFGVKSCLKDNKEKNKIKATADSLAQSVRDSILTAQGINPHAKKSEEKLFTGLEKLSTCGNGREKGCKKEIYKFTKWYSKGYLYVIPTRWNENKGFFTDERGYIDLKGNNIHWGKYTFYGAEVGPGGELRVNKDLCVDIDFYTEQ